MSTFIIICAYWLIITTTLASALSFSDKNRTNTFGSVISTLLIIVPIWIVSLFAIFTL